MKYVLVKCRYDYDYLPIWYYIIKRLCYRKYNLDNWMISKYNLDNWIISKYNLDNWIILI